MLKSLGYFPGLLAETVDGEPIQPQRRYQFIINSGFIACADDAADSVDGRVLLDWCQGDYRQNAVLRLARAVLRSTIDFNLHGKRLKSRDVYAEIMRRK